ncbi:MAG TPA: type II toxin-antitoxin system Phd/YefM family antitoxin [Chloroflexi bacterium]|nr:type II toxin-antitoxin system Phd/YefM family antitoxin [Chloroflexota bacterium]
MAEKTVSATEARIHFGELIRQVKEEQRPYIVERNGEPYVVVLSVEEYEQLRMGKQREHWRENLDRALELGAKIHAHRGNAPLPDPAEIIREMREERTRQLLETIGAPIEKSDQQE